MDMRQFLDGLYFRGVDPVHPFPYTRIILFAKHFVDKCRSERILGPYQYMLNAFFHRVGEIVGEDNDGRWV
jgi:hypothetical protein